MILKATKIFKFGAAHHLPKHKGLCKNLHGHNYELHITFSKEFIEPINENDYPYMVQDFGDIKKQLIDEETKLQEEEKRLSNPQKIIDMPQPNELEIKKIDIFDSIKKINFVLEKDYSNIKEETLKKLNKHINTNFLYSSGAEQWIRKGLKYTKDYVNTDLRGFFTDLHGFRISVLICF